MRETPTRTRTRTRRDNEGSSRIDDEARSTFRRFAGPSAIVKLASLASDESARACAAVFADFAVASFCVSARDAALRTRARGIPLVDYFFPLLRPSSCADRCLSLRMTRAEATGEAALVSTSGVCVNRTVSYAHCSRARARVCVPS